MNILLLSPYETSIRDFIEDFGDDVHQISRAILKDELSEFDADYLISYGYRHILDSDVVEEISNHAINLHLSYLPWNRGADPNLWSIIEDTPKGVTIHKISARVDSGNILAQAGITYLPQDTLATSYNKLRELIETLFCANWQKIRLDQIIGIPQEHHKATHHYKKDIDLVWNSLPHGWGTRLNTIKKLDNYR